MTPEQFVARLGPRAKPTHKPGGGWMVRCPGHQDKTPSLSVSGGRDGTLLRCFAGCPIESICGAAGVRVTDLFYDRPGGSNPAPVRPAPPSKPELPALTKGTPEQRRRLAASRELGDGAIELAASRGLVGFGRHAGHDAWFVRSSDGLNMQARRLDGGKFERRSGAPLKSQTLFGCKGAWPIGLPESEPFPVVMLAEGGPDLLAAHQLILAENREHDSAAVCITGASMNPPREAWQRLAFKRVRIYPHADEPGQRAAIRWSESLREVGAEVDAFSFDGLTRTDGQPVNDLNDFCLLNADDFEADRELWNIIPEGGKR